jgi:hypothetical protein
MNWNVREGSLQNDPVMIAYKIPSIFFALPKNKDGLQPTMIIAVHDSAGSPKVLHQQDE